MREPGQVRTVLALRPGALGDALVTLPALRALRSTYPRARITLAGNGPAARLLAQVGEVDAGTAFDDPSLSWLFGPGEPREVPHVLVAWVGETSPLWERLARWPGPNAVGAAPRREDRGLHAARRLLAALAPVGVSAPLGAGDGRGSEGWRESEWFSRPLRVHPVAADEVLVHAGSGSASKNWPAGRFAAVIRELRAQRVAVRLIEGEADEGPTREVPRAVGGELPRLRTPSLVELAARLAGCRAYVGNDSGVSHLAGLCGARATVLFGPTDPDVWSPLGPRVTALSFDAEPTAVVAEVLRGSG